MNIYKFHDKPKSLDHHDLAHEYIVELFWDKYKDNPIELKKREVAIATDARCSFKYAKDILKGPFKAGEKVIAKDAYYSYWYARRILKGPFKAGEKAIAKDLLFSYDYAKDVLKGPFKLGEAIMVGTVYEKWYRRLLVKVGKSE